MCSHLKIIILTWVFSLEFIDVMPKNVPALADMQIGHFLCINLPEFNNLGSGKLSALDQIIKWSKVHEVT
jgi:hypothetical protein